MHGIQADQVMCACGHELADHAPAGHCLASLMADHWDDDPCWCSGESRPETKPRSVIHETFRGGSWVRVEAPGKFRGRVLGRCPWCAVKAESLCRVCVARLDEWLERAGWLEGQLELNVTRQSQSGSRYREGGRSTEKPLVFDDKASEAAWVLEHTLTGLARRCVEAWGMCPSDPRRLVPWLRSRLFEVARLDDIGDVMGELQSAVDLGLATIERPEPRVYIGDCRCGRPVYGQGGDEAECRCGEIFRVAESRVANREAGADLLLTAREAALYAGELHGVQITAKRIRVWASRGKIQGRGQDRQGENVYRLGEILRVAAEKFLGSDASGP